MEKNIICMHGGIGWSINRIEQIGNLQRPIAMEAGSVVLMDLLWSDPTENDSAGSGRMYGVLPDRLAGRSRSLDHSFRGNELLWNDKQHRCYFSSRKGYGGGSKTHPIFAACRACRHLRSLWSIKLRTHGCR
ncbi:Serine/threonine-protein phosphatase BSL3 [Zea mays]|uniref:Serine/threonine-protein phosphatase BSL3 n=1 Tax=Zea mays TaxID=4577 RepID=A0A1D6LT61_MAIZE|nr:Serine/threonine-protein phosphatase BSL3 [Zea mays]